MGKRLRWFGSDSLQFPAAQSGVWSGDRWAGGRQMRWGTELLVAPPEPGNTALPSLRKGFIKAAGLLYNDSRCYAHRQPSFLSKTPQPGAVVQSKIWEIKRNNTTGWKCPTYTSDLLLSLRNWETYSSHLNVIDTNTMDISISKTPSWTGKRNCYLSHPGKVF